MISGDPIQYTCVFTIYTNIIIKYQILCVLYQEFEKSDQRESLNVGHLVVFNLSAKRMHRILCFSIVKQISTYMKNI